MNRWDLLTRDNSDLVRGDKESMTPEIKKQIKIFQCPIYTFNLNHPVQDVNI